MGSRKGRQGIEKVLILVSKISSYVMFYRLNIVNLNMYVISISFYLFISRSRLNELILVPG